MNMRPIRRATVLTLGGDHCHGDNERYGSESQNDHSHQQLLLEVGAGPPVVGKPSATVETVRKINIHDATRKVTSGIMVNFLYSS